MPDVKKLITGFLVLALGASASAWVLSNNISSASDPLVSLGASSQTALNGNAFLNESTPQDVSDLLASQAAAALDDPNNLTGTIGNSLLDGLVSSNPDGISTSTDGYQQMNMPDNQLIISELSQSPSIQNLKMPDWEAEVAADQSKTKILTKSSSRDIINYANAFTDINNKYFMATGLQQAATDASTTNSDAITNNADPSLIITAAPEISQALADATQLTVPAPFATFHKSWIKLLVYEKNTAELFQSNSNDPAQTAVAIQLEQNNYNDAIKEFNIATQNILKDKAFSEADSAPGDNVVATLENIFSIQIANAQVFVPVVDSAHIAATNAGTAAVTHMSWSTYLLNLAKNVGLQILINTLVAQLQRHVLTWIQNSGAPRFVQNWADDFANAGIMSATNYLNSNFSCVNSSIFPRVQLTLNAIYKPGNNICAAQAGSQLNSQNLTNFYNNFANGGFVTFGQTLLPSNDFYGSLFFTAQGAGQAAQQSQSLFTVKTTAQQGWKGQETCSGGADPNGFTQVCGDNSTPSQTFGCPTGWTSSGGNQCKNPQGVTMAATNNFACKDGTIPYNQANDGQCPSGQKLITTNPGQVTGQMMNQALSVTPLQITGSKTIDGLITSFATSLINAVAGQITQTASGAINGAINNTGNGGLQTIDSNSIQAPTSVSALTCSPISSIASVGEDITFTADGGYDSQGNLPTYTWKSSDGQAGTGSLFDITYKTAGTYTITLSDTKNDAPATCTAVVGATTASLPAVCAPATQTISLDLTTKQSTATFYLQGGSSSTTYIWSAPGALSTGASTTSMGGSFTATYNATGTFNVFVTASTDNSSSSCTVILQ